jgi:hypothetical protein
MRRLFTAFIAALHSSGVLAAPKVEIIADGL